MHTINGLSESIGNTPLIRIESLSKETGCNILGKAEFMNPGGSVKDRAAYALIKDAQEKAVARTKSEMLKITEGMEIPDAIKDKLFP